MQARICDGCKAIIDGELAKSEPIEVSQGYAKLSITIDPVAELCPACAKKDQYQVAKKAFESLKVKKTRKPKPAAESKPKETGKVNGEPAKKKDK